MAWYEAFSRTSTKRLNKPKMRKILMLNGVKRVYVLQAAIMEVLGMAGKLLRIISPDKIGNRDVEYYKQALDLSPGYSNCVISRIWTSNATLGMSLT